MSTQLTSKGLEAEAVASGAEPTGGTGKVLLYASGSGSDTRLYVKAGSDDQKLLGIDIDQLDALGGATVAQGDHVLVSDAGTEKKVTFSNFEDSIFDNVSGDILIAAGGAATIQANSVALATDTTGDYVQNLTAGTGLTSTGATSGENIAHSLSVDASQTQVTALGTIATGVWQGTPVATAYIADDAITGAKIALFDDSLAATTTHFLIADGSDYSSFALSGDVTCTNAGVVTIAADSVENSMLANITRGSVKVGGGSDAPTDLDAKTSGQILVGDGTDINSVAISGDISLAANGAVTIAADSVENSMLADITRGSVKVGGGSDAPTDLDAKTSGQILVGDGTDIVSVAVSGDATLAANGALTIAATSVENGMLAGSIANAKLSNSSVTVGGSAVSLGGTVTGANIAAALNSDLGGNFTLGNQSSDSATFTGAVVIGGDLTVNGTTATVNSTVVAIDDKVMVFASGSADAAIASAGGAGWAVGGDTGADMKASFLYDGVDSFDVSDHLNLASSQELKINDVSTLSATTLGSNVVNSSLTQVGTIATGVWNGTAIASAYIADDAITGAKIALFDDSLAATTTHFLIADGSDYSSFALSGDVTCTNAGVVTIAADSVENSMLANIARGSVKVGGGSDAPTDLDAKTSGQILVGDGTDIASVAVSGDATLASTGAVTLAATNTNLTTLANVTTVGALNAGSITSGFTSIDVGAGTISTTGAVDVGSLDVSDGNITNVGDIDCDSVSVADAANGLNIDFSGANTGTGKITVADGLASAFSMVSGGVALQNLNTSMQAMPMMMNKYSTNFSGSSAVVGNIGYAVDRRLAIGTDANGANPAAHILADSSNSNRLVMQSTSSLRQCGALGSLDNFSEAISNAGRVDITAPMWGVTSTTSVTATTPSFVITSATSDVPHLVVKNTNADANPAAFILQKDSASPADSDELGEIVFLGDDDGGNETEFASIKALAADVTDATEDGQLSFSVMVAGTSRAMTLDRAGLTLLNASGYGAVTAHSFVTYSDESLKTNIAPMDSALSTVKKLQGVTYDWKNDGSNDIGFIAQEVAKVVPEVVTETGNEGYFAMDYARLTAVLVEGMKEQQKQIEDLKNVVVKLSNGKTVNAKMATVKVPASTELLSGATSDDAEKLLADKYGWSDED